MAPAFDSDTTVTTVEDQISTEVEGEIVVLDLERGQYFGLEGVGSRIWELLAEPTDVQEVQRTIQEEFQVEPERARRDIRAFLNELADANLVYVVDE